jgi:hypothetical protein
MAKHSSHVLDMARKGAEHRYEELKAEIAALVKNFPHLTVKPSRTAQMMAKGRATVEAEVIQVRRRTKKMSAAARKAVSERMKKLWAERRKAK